MKRAALLGLILALAPVLAWSGEAESSHRKAARELIEVERAWRDPMAVAEPVFEGLLLKDPEMEPYRDVILEWLRKNLSWKQLTPGLADVYVQTFTEDELRQLTAFYKSAVGQKALKQGSALNKAEAMAALDLLIEHHAELDAMIEVAKAKEPARTPDETLALANRLFDEKKWSEARDAYLEYLVSSPDDPDARTDLGSSLQALGEYGKALEQFDRVLDRDPKHWQTLYNKIVVLGFNLGRKPEAEKLLVKLRELQPDNAEVEALGKALKEN
jgi:hypothetical protein